MTPEIGDLMLDIQFFKNYTEAMRNGNSALRPMQPQSESLIRGLIATQYTILGEEANTQARVCLNS